MRLVILISMTILVIPTTSQAAEEPPPDPFDQLVTAASELADLAQQLKPAKTAVDAKTEAVARKQAELADAQTAEQTAKGDFNDLVAAFIAAIDKLKEAAQKIQPIPAGS